MCCKPQLRSNFRSFSALWLPNMAGIASVPRQSHQQALPQHSPPASGRSSPGPSSSTTRTCDPPINSATAKIEVEGFRSITSSGCRSSSARIWNMGTVIGCERREDVTPLPQDFLAIYRELRELAWRLKQTSFQKGFAHCPDMALGASISAKQDGNVISEQLCSCQERNPESSYHCKNRPLPWGVWSDIPSSSAQACKIEP